MRTCWRSWAQRSRCCLLLSSAKIQERSQDEVHVGNTVARESELFKCANALRKLCESFAKVTLGIVVVKAVANTFLDYMFFC